ncbi:MAG: hypothetical protein KF893_25570 [Caldilineaceae bacterium]|nr:hypothetical protein [Caldilineaceae bacterium]
MGATMTDTRYQGPATVGVDLVLAAFDAVTEQPKVAQPSAQAQQIPPIVFLSGAGAGRNEPYVQSIIDSELRALASAPNGSRNNQLYKTASRFGELVAYGYLSESEAETLCMDGARSNGSLADDGEAQCLKTIRGGLRKGKGDPKPIPPPGPGRDTADAIAAAQPAVGMNGSAHHNGSAPRNGSSASTSTSTAPSGGQAASTGAPSTASGAGPAVAPLAATWPYSNSHGRMVYNYFDKGSNQNQSVNIADFTARITEAITDEDGERTFVVEGEGIRGGKFRVEIPAETIGEDRRLRAILEGAVGALDPVYAGQGKHLAPAIKKMTDEQSLILTKRYSRTGWTSDRQFLIPGREPAGIRIDLNRKLPYSISPKANINIGLQALEALIESVGPEKTTVILSHGLTGPIAKIAGWRNERYAVFVKGLTGTFKTSVSQLIMAIYGPYFIRDERLIKWGEGATRNAVMALATGAGDLPFLIDNYKPQTGGGDRDFINLIHNILEGGEKDRLNRSAQLRETKPVHCWPVITGEDVPVSDSASLARVLLVNFEKQPVRQNANLTFAQQKSEHLSSIGAAWLDWIEGDAGQERIGEICANFDQKRALWADYLYRRRADLANPLRVATNLAMNELIYTLACENPIFGGLLKQYQRLHIAGLETVADAMAEGTAESLEALRFLAALRELLATDRALLLDKSGAGTGVIIINPQDRDRVIGWEDTDGSAYLLAEMTISLIERHTKERFNSNRQLFSQLDDLGLLGNRDKGRQTKNIKIGGKSYRTVHIKKEGFCT